MTFAGPTCSFRGPGPADQADSVQMAACQPASNGWSGELGTQGGSAASEPVLNLPTSHQDGRMRWPGRGGGVEAELGTGRTFSSQCVSGPFSENVSDAMV